MNDDKHLRSVKELDKAGCKWYSISRYLLRTLYDQLYQENDNLWCVSIGETVEHIEKEDLRQLHDDLVTLGYDAEELKPIV